MDSEASVIGGSRPGPRKPPLSLSAHLVQDNVPAMIMPKLYIGSVHAAFNQEELKRLGITHVLNTTQLPATFPRSFTYLTIDIRDKDFANILSCIPAANIFIEAGIEAGGVLVHCMGGRSRSAAFISAYLMSSHGLTFEESMARLRTHRPVVNINRGFEKQLRAYSMTSFDVYVAHQVLLRQRIRALHLRRAEHMLARNLSFDTTGDATADEQERGSQSRSYGRTMSFSLGRFTTKRRESCMIEVTTPLIRLSRPGSNAMRVIPPLRGLGRAFACANCHIELFTLANVVRLDLDLTSMLDVEDVRSETASSVDDFDERLSCDNGDGLHRKLSRSSFGSFRVNREPKVVDHRPQRGIAFSKIDVDSGDDSHQAPLPPRTKVPDGTEFSFDIPAISLSAPPRSPRGRQMGESKMELATSPNNWMFQDAVERRDRALSLLSSEPGTPIDTPTRDTLTRDEVVTPTPRTPPLSPYSHLNASTPMLLTPQQPPQGSPNRPLSAEKRRWLERMKLLRESDHPRVAQVAQADDEAIQLGIASNTCIYLEYLEWMGALDTILQQDTGNICCSRCAKLLGNWSWGSDMDATVEPPTFRIDMAEIVETNMTLDVTPCQTPRLDEQYSQISEHLEATDDDTIIPSK